MTTIKNIKKLTIEWKTVIMGREMLKKNSSLFKIYSKKINNKLSRWLLGWVLLVDGWRIFI